MVTCIDTFIRIDSNADVSCIMDPRPLKHPSSILFPVEDGALYVWLLTDTYNQIDSNADVSLIIDSDP